VRKPAKSSRDLTGLQDQTTAHESTIKNAAATLVAPEMDQKSISELIRFFKLLDKWDHEVTNGKVV
jgi:hypothetical protein